MAARGALARHDCIEIGDESTESDVEFDLAPFEVPGPSSGLKRRRSQTEDDEPGLALGGTAEAGPSRQTARQKTSGEDFAVKVEWTDDSDGEYERLKKRKRGASGRGRGGKKKPEATKTNGKGKGRAAETIAGSSSRRTRGGRRAFVNDADSIGPKANQYGAAKSDDDDAAEDLTIPDYIRQRRREFDEGRAVLKDAGLRLPPDYTDIYFSDDDNERRHRHRVPASGAFAALAGGSSRASSRAAEKKPELTEEVVSLQQRPQFDASVRPSRARKDITLEYSAGVIPACIAQYLRDYQVTGVQFLHQCFVYQRGGILGDDMGLGKTVQVAAFLTAAFGKTGDERDDKRMRKMRRAEPLQGSVNVNDSSRNGRWYPVVLVVCPGSLIQNWRSELQRWGWWHVDLYHGAGKDDVLQAARAGRLEIMVTTYATYKNHRDRINSVRWDAVVADECHVLKECTSETTKAMNEVNALCRIGLTGTAIQNRYEELWTLLNWTNPGRFGTLAEWRHTISRPLTVGQSHDATIYQLSLARRTAKKLVQNLLPDYFLRRMKSLIAHQLPRKTDRVVFCPLTDRQSQAYENFINSEQVEFLRRASEECDCGSGSKRGWCHYRTLPDTKTTWFSLVFPTIQSLLKLSNHLTLLIPAADAIVPTENTANPDAHLSAAAVAVNERYQRAMDVLKACEPDEWATLYRNRDSLVNLANPDFCGKWKVLRKLLRFWHENGDKVLVFSHNVRLLRILQHLFHNTSYSVSYLDGSLSYDERQRVVDDFNGDPDQFVFLISTKAGGVGLNITSANKVVIFDPHWNPAYDLQAQDRAYRIGQMRDVDVFRLVSAGTIEEIVYARQIYKQQQANIGYSASSERRYFRGVQEDSARQGEIFGLNNLFTFHTDQVVLRDIVNKTNIAEAKAGVHLTPIDMEQAAADRENEVLVKIEGAAGANQLAHALEAENGSNSRAAAARSDADDHNAADALASKSKSDAIQAILASAGVEYTHDNSEVVGSSRVEAQLSRRAELALADEDDPDHDNSTIANGSRAYGDRASSTDSDGDGGGGPLGPGPAGRSVDLSLLLGDSTLAAGAAADDSFTLELSERLQYNPPEDVMRRQFCTMAREAGFATATDFALVVEGWTPEQRRQCLEVFYGKREARLREIMEASKETEGEEEDDAEGGNTPEEIGEVEEIEEIQNVADSAREEPVEESREPEEIASLVIVSENVIERRELYITKDEMEKDKMGEDKGKDKDKTEQKPKGVKGEESRVKDEKGEDRSPVMARVKEEQVDDKSPLLPLVKRESEAATVQATPARVKREPEDETRNVRVKAEDNSAVLLSSSPVVEPAVSAAARPIGKEHASVQEVSAPPPAMARPAYQVIDDSDDTDEL